MFMQFILKRMTLEKQVKYIVKNGVYLGSRSAEKRVPHLYMLGKKIAEIVFEEDDTTKKPETLIWHSGLQQLELSLEKEFKSNF